MFRELADTINFFGGLLLVLGFFGLVAVFVSWICRVVNWNFANLDLDRLLGKEKRQTMNLVYPVGGMLPVRREMIESGQADSALLSLLAGYIEAIKPPANVPQSLTYAPKFPNRIEQTEAPQIEDKQAPAVEPKDIWQLWTAGLLPDHGFFMGWNLDTGEQITADWLQLYSALVGGLTGSGKSTLIRSVLVQSALQGGRFVVLDRHYGAGEESLGASLLPLRPLMLCDVAANEGQMVDALRWVGDIGKRRLAGKDTDKAPLILVVDETTAMFQRSNIAAELGRILGEIAQETRKVGVYAMCIGQNFSARIMPTEIRNSFASFISCRARSDVARAMSGNLEFAHAAADLHVGQAVWMNTSGDLIRLAVPNATQRHVELVARQCLTGVEQRADSGYPHWETGSFEPAPGNRLETGRKSSGVLDLPLDPKAIRAIEMFEAGHTQSQIIAEVWQPTSKGRPYQDAANEFQNIIREYIYQLRGTNGR